jgi:hypothetical protein
MYQKKTTKKFDANYSFKIAGTFANKNLYSKSRKSKKMNNKLGLSLLLFLFFTLPYLNCFNENKICNIFNPCNECMKEYSEKVIKSPFYFHSEIH